MSDPVQQVVAGNEFNEGYRYVHMRERDVELYEKSNRNRFGGKSGNNFYWCKVDPGYIQPDDGVLATKLLVVSSTIYFLLSMGDDDIENEKEEYIGRA